MFFSTIGHIANKNDYSNRPVVWSDQWYPNTINPHVQKVQRCVLWLLEKKKFHSKYVPSNSAYHRAKKNYSNIQKIMRLMIQSIAEFVFSLINSIEEKNNTKTK